MRLFLILAALAWGQAAAAQDFSALARVVPGEVTALERRDGSVGVGLGLSQAVPWRVRLMTAPQRVVLEFREVDWTDLDPAWLTALAPVRAVDRGTTAEGWSRLSLVLTGPYGIRTAGMTTDPVTGGARVSLELEPVTAEDFAAQAVHDAAPATGPAPAEVAEPRRRQSGLRPLRVALDPGHGGHDPGAEHGGIREAELMLSFARELKEVLLRGGFEVVMTRDEDVFVSLEQRVDIARTADADVFLSLHADSVAEGRATGASVYTLSDTAAADLPQELAQRRDRGALIAGVDLKDQDDAIAEVLLDLARQDTDPRSDRLAAALVKGIEARTGAMHKRPLLSAGFSVLKAPDIPSVLIELGFLSSDMDRGNLTSERWRASAAEGIHQALADWAEADAAEAGRLRR